MHEGYKDIEYVKDFFFLLVGHSSTYPIENKFLYLYSIFDWQIYDFVYIPFCKHLYSPVVQLRMTLFNNEKELLQGT